MAIRRPHYNSAFFDLEKQLDVYFYTSNVDKYLQARTVFSRAGFLLNHFRSRSDPYPEDYTVSKSDLLAKALVEIMRAVGVHKAFFVEDTSLRIDALSDATDYPGLQVKEWFADTNFEALDANLRDLGRGRRATVSSDIALHLPGLDEPVLFHGATSGAVAERPPDFAPNPQFPWLTPMTFNGWFVPDDCDRPLGAMSLEESWAQDFRVKALTQLVERLAEYTAALNLQSGAYRRRPGLETTDQLSLFATSGPVLLVVGPACAGKTSFGVRAEQHHDLSVIEASSVMRLIGTEFEHQGRNFGSVFDMARAILEEKGPDAVARRVLASRGGQLKYGAVITGFRTLQEIEVFREQVPGCVVVSVSASERTRFQRHLARGRDQAIATIEAFRKLDRDQEIFGLLPVVSHIADVRIMNEGDLDEYWLQVDAVVAGSITRTRGIAAKPHRLNTSTDQVLRCLQALEAVAHPMTTDEIEHWLATHGRAIRPNNANKMLKRVPALARRLELDGTRVRYDITDAGRSYLRQVLKPARA
jgi:inosine/xanthosine triphosphate pyrophosphatase family protein/dephospho-CoA kinase